jgi:tripartite ATP-independent transporter DctM subunit
MTGVNAETLPHPTAIGGLVETLGQWLDRIIAAVAVCLLLFETALLFTGVVFRYLLHRPLVWSDELNAILFLWLGILGAVMAVRRWRHMRMSTFVIRLSARSQSVIADLGIALIAVLLVLMLPSAMEHVSTESAVITPTLELSQAWRAAAMPVGIVLMLFETVQRLMHLPRRNALTALAAIIVLVALLALAKPIFAGLGQANLAIIFLFGVPVMVFSGMPIAYAFIAATFAYLSLATYIPTSVLVARIEAGMSNLLLLAIPTFVFLGVLIDITGMAERMIGFLANLLGHIRGGLHYVLVVAMYLVSGISGSKAADMAAIAPALFPEMEKLGHDRSRMTALLAATGAQTETVPPSLILIAVGSVSGLSIAGLFTAGLLPAAILGLFLVGVVWRETRGDHHQLRPRTAQRVVWLSFLISLPGLALPFVIRAAVVEGAATATEVSTIGIAYTIVVGLLVYRRFDWPRLWPMLIDTATLSGAILFVTGAATAMAWAITSSGFSHSVTAMIQAVPGGVVTFMALSVLLFAALGSVLEGLPAIVLFGPLMFPTARANGVDEIYYAIVAILAMSLGLFTPPFGVGFYITCAIGGADPNKAMRHLWPYLGALAVGVVLIAAVPWFSTGFLK